ncbi:MAG: hypothetical protein JW395_1122 [Nitrospira sp.]|nr:hypothetical protein [Nitrospira sp.]
MEAVNGLPVTKQEAGVQRQQLAVFAHVIGKVMDDTRHNVGDLTEVPTGPALIET